MNDMVYFELFYFSRCLQKLYTLMELPKFGFFFVVVKKEIVLLDILKKFFVFSFFERLEGLF